MQIAPEGHGPSIAPVGHENLDRTGFCDPFRRDPLTLDIEGLEVLAVERRHDIRLLAGQDRVGLGARRDQDRARRQDREFAGLA